jgi:two-component system sensor histidine kinase AtoS
LTYPRLWEKTTSALSKIAHTKRIIYILVALGPLSIIGIVFIFIKFFTRPLNTLLKATERLKEGDLDYRVEGLKDEFGKVADAFNEMSASLKEQMIKMQRTEQMVVLGELSAGLAHEIKNPLTGIKLSLEVISNEASISKENKDIMLKLTDECRRIDSLLKNLLNFAKPPQPKLVLIDINSVLDKTISFSLQHASLLANADASIKVSKDLDKKIPEIMADPIKLQQAFLNLLLNAVHAMPDGGTLSVLTSYDKEANIIRIKLSDTGKGIDNEVISRIFQPFFTTKPKGTGLGLAITKRIIEQHDGTLNVENNQDGGAAFTISIPVSKSKKE